jgi:hypothetical protein
MSNSRGFCPALADALQINLAVSRSCSGFSLTLATKLCGLGDQSIAYTLL